MQPTLPHSDACERNREPILGVLRTAFAQVREVLEIGSGTGQHAVHFAAAMPWLAWQPTDRRAALDGLAARVRLQGSANLRIPLELDVATDDWPGAVLDPAGWHAVFSANTLHIMSAPQVERCFAALQHALAPGALLAIYGPFRYRGSFTTESNAQFDTLLRQRDPASGIRDAEWVDALAAAAGLALVADHDMPANNQLRVWRRDQGGVKR